MWRKRRDRRRTFLGSARNIRLAASANSSQDSMNMLLDLPTRLMWIKVPNSGVELQVIPIGKAGTKTRIREMISAGAENCDDGTRFPLVLKMQDTTDPLFCSVRHWPLINASRLYLLVRHLRALIPSSPTRCLCECVGVFRSPDFNWSSWVGLLAFLSR